jgi:hypothetical protein
VPEGDRRSTASVGDLFPVLLLFPLALLLDLFPEWSFAAVFRVLVLASVLPALARPGRLVGAERRWGQWLLLFGFATGVSALSAIASSDIDAAARGEALLDLGRQLYLFTFSFGLALALRTQRARERLSKGMALVCVGGAIVTVTAYTQYAGLRWIGASELPALKLYAVESLGIGLNGLAYSTLLSGFIAAPWATAHRIRLGVLLSAVGAVLLLSGARATAMTAIVAFSASIGAHFLKSLDGHIRASAAFIFTGAMATVAYIVSGWGALWDPYALSVATTGRLDLWVAGIRKFVDYPFVGAGAGSWRGDLLTYMPSYARHGADGLAEHLQSGAYHNAFITLLAEKGTVAFVPGVLLIAFLIGRSWRLDPSTFGHRDDRVAAFIAPGATFGILASMTVEGFAYFGNANGPGDFLAYAAASLVVALSASAERAHSSARDVLSRSRYTTASPLGHD